MLKKEQIDETLQQDENLSEGTDYNVMPQSKLSMVITLKALEALVEKFGEESLKESESAGVFSKIDSIDYKMEINGNSDMSTT